MTRFSANSTTGAKTSALISRLSSSEYAGRGIVYVFSRNRAETLNIALNNASIKSVVYHAGLQMNHREANHSSWDSGQARVIVATTAFGFGIDRRDVRSVIVFSMPNSAGLIAQLFGRAGRDGESSVAEIFYTDQQDIARWSFLLRFQSRPSNSLHDISLSQIEDLDDAVGFCTSLNTCRHVSVSCAALFYNPY